MKHTFFIFSLILSGLFLSSNNLSAQYTDYYFYLSNQTTYNFSEVWLAPTGSGNWQKVYFPYNVQETAQITFRGYRYQDLYIRTNTGGYYRHNRLDMAVVETIKVYSDNSYRIVYFDGSHYSGRY